MTVERCVTAAPSHTTHVFPHALAIAEQEYRVTFDRDYIAVFATEAYVGR